MLAQPLRPQDISTPINTGVKTDNHGPAPTTIVNLKTSKEGVNEDVMGQFLQLYTYNHGLSLFKLDDGISHSTIADEIQTAAGKIIEAIPWLGHRVIREGTRSGFSGRYRAAEWPGDSPQRSFIRIKDCTELCPSYDELVAAQAPTKMLDGKVLCPVPGFPMPYSVEEFGDPPVCLVQVNFIKGGALLNFSNQHNVMDGTGMFKIITLLASVLNGDPISAETIEQGNRNPATAVPLYGSGEQIRDHSWLKWSGKLPPTESSPRPAKWCQLRFSRKAAQTVKATASDRNGYDSTVPFISSEDAIIALYWKCLARFRIKDGVDASRPSRMLRAIDSRGVLKVSHSFMGQLVYYSRTFLTLDELQTLPLSTIACSLRKNLTNDNTEFSVRSYATWLSKVPDKSTLIYCGPADRTTDVSCSSMSNASLLFEFGRLGQPKYIRRPQLPPVPGTLYFYPPDATGDLNILVCLNDEEMKELAADELWGPATEVIG